MLHAQSLAGFQCDSVDKHQARIRIVFNRSEVEPVLDILEPYLEKLPDAAALLALPALIVLR